MPEKTPAPVEVKNPEPISVELTTARDSAAQTEAKAVASSARVDADILRTDDQRRISGIWERTQQIIAISVVEVSLLIAIAIVWRRDQETPTVLTVLFGLANLVIGFYFGRTNHQRVGGVGSNEVGGR